MKTVFSISAYPQPGIAPRIVILIIVLIAMVVATATGMALPDAVTMVIAAGLAACPVAQAILPGPTARAIR